MEYNDAKIIFEVLSDALLISDDEHIRNMCIDLLMSIDKEDI